MTSLFVAWHAWGQANLGVLVGMEILLNKTCFNKNWSNNRTGNLVLIVYQGSTITYNVVKHEQIPMMYSIW